MPPARRARYGPSRAPRYKWCAFSIIRTFEPAGSQATTFNETLPICGPLGDFQMQGDVTIERIITMAHIRRVGVSNLDAAVLGIAIQEVVPSTGLPKDVINFLDLTDAPVTIGSKNILGMYPVMVPPRIINAGQTAEIADGSTYLHIFEFNGRRRLERLHQGLFMSCQADVAAMIQGFITTRTLVRFTGG